MLFRFKGNSWGGRKMAEESIAICYLGTIKKYFSVFCGISWALQYLTTIPMGSWQTIDRNQRKGTTTPSGLLKFNFRPSKRNCSWKVQNVHTVKIEKFLCKKDLGQWEWFEDLPWIDIWKCYHPEQNESTIKKGHFVSLISLVQHFTHIRRAVSA